MRRGTQLGSNLLLYLLITGLAGVVDFKDFQSQFEERRGLYTGLACQYGLLPLLGFVVVSVLQMDEVVGITLLVATSSPGTPQVYRLADRCVAQLELGN